MCWVLATIKLFGNGCISCGVPWFVLQAVENVVSGVVVYYTSKKWHECVGRVMRVLGFGNYQTVWEWLHKLRCAMVCPDREQLSGVVGDDETLVGGGKSGKRGRDAEGKTLVLIAVEDNEGLGIGRIRLGQVPDASGESLLKFVEKNIERGSTASEQIAGRVITVCLR